MLETTENLCGLEIYSPDGIFVGIVNEMIIDISSMVVSGLFVNDPNPYLVDEGVSISIPMRWVQSVGDVIILDTFPEKVEKPVQ